MRTPKQIAEGMLYSEAEHKRRATTLRQLAGGLRAQRTGPCGLDDKEVEIVARAVALLEQMAGNSTAAAAMVRQRAQAHAVREKQIKVAMQGTFTSLTSVADRIALIGAVKSYLLRQGGIYSLESLRLDAEDALDGLAYTLAGQDLDKPAAAVVDAAWQKFVAAKAEIQQRYASQISLLEALTPAREAQS